MDWLFIAVVLAVGFVLGFLTAYLLKLNQLKASREIAEELYRKNETRQQENMETVLESVKLNFGNLALDALSKSTEEFLKLAKTCLESEREVGVREIDVRKSLIDQQLQRMNLEIDNVVRLVRDLEQDREKKFGELSSQLKSAGEQTAALLQTTGMIREVLSNSRARGQWGERMAEDILKAAGLMENVNYVKQKNIEGLGTRPDFTFLLPKNLKLNMDVKFSLDNYVRCLEAKSHQEKLKYKNDFLRDVKNRIKEITTRDYINPEQKTVDYVVLFIPNDQIYSFIHEQEGSILDFALGHRVIVCSPITLFAVLAVIRQAVDNFALEETSNEILSLFGSFKKQWDQFHKKLESLGRKIVDLQKDYEVLSTTRRRQLERPLDKIEELRTQKGLCSASLPQEEQENQER
ncbi:DNA recombination protein RmuC [Candidatus Contubernalis alkaliaceticus]|uniref:DNA recombination protein RmuC n=1 Tax=Candidatus Contubernalis alkaliaceticus TaxID=338645 RepID=UPI001F4BD9CC|nr:DNA recombination protein RmuC [Candidatus Contubernalis alkalaceticus]UNC91882.1 DNA recombination protein RmuC [Candidatus Contubernalis alkalaceticus]